MEDYLKNLHGQEYKMVPIEPEAKTIVPLTDGKQPPQMPPAAKLD
jgi:potassium efflux system protein